MFLILKDETLHGKEQLKIEMRGKSKVALWSCSTIHSWSSTVWEIKVRAFPKRHKSGLF